MSARMRVALCSLVLVSLATAAVAIGGCKPGGDAAPKSAEPRFSMFILEPVGIDPLNAVESEGIQVCQAVFDGLVDLDDRTSEAVPAVAETWTCDADATTWTFKLRHGVRFHNGREVTARDFKYAWERICDPDNESAVSYHLDAIEGYQAMQEKKASALSGVSCPDTFTLKVELSRPYSEFYLVTAHPAFSPVPAEEVAKDPKAFGTRPVGNGPFKVTGAWKSNRSVVLSRFDGYYGTKPSIEGVTFRIFQDEKAAFMEFRAGDLDMTPLPSGALKAAEAKYGKSPDGYTARPRAQVLTGRELGVYFLTVNVRDKVLQSADLRRAISLAINRKAIVDVVREGAGKPADGMVPEGYKGYETGLFGYSRYDVPRAKKLLAQAGYPNGKDLPVLKLLVSTGSGNEDVAQLVMSDLKKIGVECTLDTVEQAQYLDLLRSGKYQISRAGWNADYPTWGNFLNTFFNSANIGADNVSRYGDDEVDKMLAQAMSTADEGARIAAFKRAERRIGEACPAVPIYFYWHRHVTSARFGNVIYTPMGYVRFEKIEPVG